MVPFAPGEVQRVAEYFDGDVQQAYAFTRQVWLPDAVRSVGVLDRAIRHCDAGRALFMCDHLRESARTVGAAVVVDGLTHVESLLQRRQWTGARQATKSLSTQISDIAQWLERRIG